MYSAADLKLFAGKEIFSTVKQGDIGDCYLISALVSMDSRPGAMEEMFVDTNINSAGVYGLKFYVNGERVVVLVDDYVPAAKKWVELSTGW